jgi:S-adenosylmethionine:tRNA ribosyltransferase-isomerase
LPKYINRPCETGDREWYQTIFAKDIGAVAAPTAGMHFSKELMKRMEIKGVEFAPITLHLGLGTFRTIDVEDLSKHKMDAEFYRVPPETVNLVNVAKNKERTARSKVCAIGTTSLRAVESAVSAEGQLKTVESGWTNKFIFPPFDFNIADSLISNFHLPKSSLLIMVAAFGGHELIMHAYEEALKEDYRLFSYGDAMFIK